MNMKNVSLVVIAFFSSILIAGCSPDLSPNTYDASQVGVAGKVVSGVIIEKRVVNIDNNSGAGGLVGVAAGGTAGSLIGGSPVAHILGAIAGAVAGGVAGNAIDKGIHHQQGLEYIIRLKKGSTISVVQTPDMQFAVGQHVLVIYGGTKTRLILDETAGN